MSCVLRGQDIYNKVMRWLTVERTSWMSTGEAHIYAFDKAAQGRTRSQRQPTGRYQTTSVISMALSASRELCQKNPGQAHALSPTRKDWTFSNIASPRPSSFFFLFTTSFRHFLLFSLSPSTFPCPALCASLFPQLIRIAYQNQKETHSPLFSPSIAVS